MKRYILLIGLIVLWWVLSHGGFVPNFMLPSPEETVKALVENAGLIGHHLTVSLAEAGLGLGLSVVFSFVIAVLMDSSKAFEEIVFPGLIVSQTVPVIAIAPLLILWLGYGILPKIVLIFLVCFFPVTVSLFTGLKSAEEDQIRLFRSMNAGKLMILREVKLPQALPSFFSGLRIAAAYSIVGAVIAEWLGGQAGLGVYMTLARKNFAYDEMFAIIIVVCVLSLVLIKIVDLAEKASMPWKNRGVKA